MTATQADIAANIAEVRERIAAAAARAGRDPQDIALVGIAKTQPAEVVVQTIRAGLTLLGENRVQEAAEKIPRVAELLGAESAGVRWHLVGHLQRNKVRDALRLFSVVESVDSVRLAQALNTRTDGTLPIMLEVYAGNDPARPGFRPDEVEQAVDEIQALPNLDIQGLMTVAPLETGVSGARDAFATLRKLREQLKMQHPRVHWRHLSMGMSEDFEIAIEEGATMVRVGRALFGPRNVA